MFRFLKIFSVIFISLTGFLAFHIYSNAPVTTEEIIRPDEKAQAEKAVERFHAVIEKNKTDYYARGAHAKGHACVKAMFNVNADLNKDLQHGVLTFPGKTFKSWIRFSNGASAIKGNDDTNRDARGMAIKLFDIYDNELKRQKDYPETQDFLMHDHPVFFTANIDDYNRFLKSEADIGYFISGFNPFKWRLREMIHGLATLKTAPPSPVWNQYFSNTAYKLGPHNIKFSAKSCSEYPLKNTEASDPDFLRKRLQKELSSGTACFSFMVQLQKPDKYMPIEDPSIEWEQDESAYIPVATITIPEQQFDSSEQQQFCEDLSFSPWNNLPEHRPIGELNRIRKMVYEASSRFRHKKNNRSVPTNLGW